MDISYLIVSMFLTLSLPEGEGGRGDDEGKEKRGELHKIIDRSPIICAKNQ